MKKMFFMFMLMFFGTTLFGCQKSVEEQFIETHMPTVLFQTFKNSDYRTFSIEGITITNIEYTYSEHTRNYTDEVLGYIEGSATYLNILFSYDVGESSFLYDPDNISRMLHIRYVYGTSNGEILESSIPLSNTRDSYDNYVELLEETFVDDEGLYFVITNIQQGVLSEEQIQQYIEEATLLNDQQS